MKVQCLITETTVNVYDDDDGRRKVIIRTGDEVDGDDDVEEWW